MGSLRVGGKPLEGTRVRSRTLVVIAVVLALVDIYRTVQPNGLECAQTMFSEISNWVQKRF